jgi:hypothetical protein
MGRIKTNSILRAALTLLLAGFPATGWSLCLRQSMDAKWGWENVNDGGLLRRLEIRFTCDDTGPVIEEPQALVHAVGPCESGTCDWGEVVAHYDFLDVASGSPDTTRVDARFTRPGETIDLVILLLSADQLLVHWSLRFPEGSPDKDFSLVEFFRPRKCLTIRGKLICVARYTRVQDRPESPSLERAIP